MNINLNLWIQIIFRYLSRSQLSAIWRSISTPPTRHVLVIYRFMKTRVSLNLRTLQISPKKKLRRNNSMMLCVFFLYCFRTWKNDFSSTGGRFVKKNKSLTKLSAINCRWRNKNAIKLIFFLLFSNRTWKFTCLYRTPASWFTYRFSIHLSVSLSSFYIFHNKFVYVHERNYCCEHFRSSVIAKYINRGEKRRAKGAK